jgi:LacI family transcriptional regulator
MSGKRFADLLYNRGIRGLIFVPPPEPSVELRIPRERFASLALGYSFTAPNNLHRLCPDYFRAARLAITELMRFGCRKIGLVLNRGDMGKSNHGILGAYEGFRVELGGELVSIPFCFVDHMSWNEGAREQVMTWRARHQPDAILTLNAPLDTWCREEGLRVPEDVRIAWINNPRIVRYGGTDLNREDIGRKAVELVAWFLRKQLIGIPEDPLVCMVPPRWIPGNLSG